MPLPIVYTLRGCEACMRLLQKWAAQGVASEERRVELNQATLDEALRYGIIVPIVVGPDRGVEQGFGGTSAGSSDISNGVGPVVYVIGFFDRGDIVMRDHSERIRAALLRFKATRQEIKPIEPACAVQVRPGVREPLIGLVHPRRTERSAAATFLFWRVALDPAKAHRDSQIRHHDSPDSSIAVLPSHHPPVCTANLSGWADHSRFRGPRPRLPEIRGRCGRRLGK
jgi:hypothetical protein